MYNHVKLLVNFKFCNKFLVNQDLELHFPKIKYGLLINGCTQLPLPTPILKQSNAMLIWIYAHYPVLQVPKIDPNCSWYVGGICVQWLIQITISIGSYKTILYGYSLKCGWLSNPSKDTCQDKNVVITVSRLVALKQHPQYNIYKELCQTVQKTLLSDAMSRDRVYVKWKYKGPKSA